MDRIKYLLAYDVLFTRNAGVGSGSAPERRRAPRISVLWATWRFAAIEVEIAYDHWNEARQPDRDRAYAVYADALQREGEAAGILAERYGAPAAGPAAGSVLTAGPA